MTDAKIVDPVLGDPVARDAEAGPAVKRSPPWPTLGERAYHGPIGRAVRLIEPETEADSAAILMQLIAALGNCIGPDPHVRVEDDRHRALVWPVIVGETSKARKGTSWSRVRELMSMVARPWADENLASGLSSGEGLIWAVRDPVEGYNAKQDAFVTIDAGVTDKRRLVVENEFASVLVEAYEAPTGRRLKITDARSGVSVLLDALELESLAWAEHTQLDPLLDPSLARWRNAESDDGAL